MDRKTLLQILSIGLVGFLSPAGAAIASGLAYFQQYYSDVDRIWIQMLLIGPSITAVPACLLAGKLCSKFGYKSMIICGEVLSVLGGLLPLWLRYFPLLVVSRLILGIGMGLAGTAATGLIYCAYDDVMLKAKCQAIIQAAGYVGTLAFTIIGGWLSDIRWDYCFLAYFLGIPVIIISLLYTPPVITETKKEKVPLFVPIKSTAIILMILLGLMSGLISIFGNNISGYIINGGFGNALTAGISQGFLDVAGFFGCLFGIAIYMKTDRWILAACSFVCGITYLIFAGAGSLPVIFITAMVFGFVESIRAPLVATMLSEMQPGSTMTSVCGVSSLFDRLLSTLIVLSFTKIFTDGNTGNERVQFFAAGIGFIILAVITLIFALKNKRPRIEDMPR